MYTDYTEENNNESYYEDNGNNQDKEKLKKIVFFVLVFVIALILIVVLAKGCSNKKPGTSYTENQTPSIAINRQSLSLEAGEEFQLYADVLMSSSENPVVGWYSEDSSIVSVNDEGFVTAVSEGTTNVVAIYRQDGQVYNNKCSVVVTSAAVQIESIDIVQEDITMQIGKSLLLEVSVEPSDAKTETLVFTSDDSSIATVSEEGYVNAISNGTTTIKVKTEDGRLSDSITVTVNETGTTVINPVSLQLIGLANGVSVGTTSEILYILLPGNATNTNLVWSSSDPSVATVNNGVVTGVRAGTCKIIASTSNNISSSLEITVQSNKVPVTAITINGETAITMQTGGTRLLTYTISPDNATNKNVKYTTSNSNVVLVDSNGILAAVGSGNAIVTITTEDGSKTAIVNVTVKGESSSSTSSSSQTGSSSSSEGSSSNNNSSGSTSSSSTTSSSSSSTTSSSTSGVSCSNNLMTYISHNGKSVGAVVSSIQFSNAKPFKNMTETPKITFTEIAECLNENRLYYNIYYGTTADNVSTSSYKSGTFKLNSSIELNKGDGYYKIRVYGYLDGSSSVKFTKYYYAIVEGSSSQTTTTAPTLKLSVSFYNSSTNRATVNFSANSSVGLSEIRYCISTTGGTCTPVSSSSKIPLSTAATTYGTSKTFTNVVSGTRVCAVAVDKNNARSGVVCTSSTAMK